MQLRSSGRGRFSRLRVYLLIKYLRLVFARPYTILGAVLLPTAACVVCTYLLFRNIRTDFATLLPENDRSVLHLGEITRRLGGAGSIFVAVSSPDFTANARFAEALAQKISRYPRDVIKSVDYNMSAADRFFSQRSLYFLELSELAELRSALNDMLGKMRLQVLGLDFDEYRPEAAIQRITANSARRRRMQNPFGTNLHGYFADAAGENLVLMVRPAAETSDLNFSREIVSRLSADIRALRPESFHPALDAGLAGTPVAVLENVSAISAEIAGTALLTVALVLFSVWLFYRSFRMVLILCFTITIGVLLTFGVAYYFVGALNQQSAFLASIIVGNGINFGIIQMARFMEEYSRGIRIRRAVRRAFILTMSATFMAALATSLSYAILSVMKFRGFSQFGFIGGIGMMLCWLSFSLLIPCLLVIAHRMRPMRARSARHFSRSRFSEMLAGIIVRHDRTLVRLLYVIAPVSLLFSLIYVSVDRFEYDLKKIGNIVSEAKGSEAWYMKKIDRILGNHTNSSVILSASRKDADQGARHLQALIQQGEKEGKPLLISGLMWLDMFVPTEQRRKYALMREISALLRKFPVPVAYRLADVPPFTAADLPEIVRGNFREKDGTEGRVLMVTASPAANLSDLRDLVRIAGEIDANLKLSPDGELRAGTHLFAGDSLIFVDIIRNISREGPLVFLICFLSVALLIFAGFRNGYDFAVVFVFLSFGLTAFIGTIMLMQIKLNFFNFITVPITIGIGVDYAINIYYRYVADGKKSVRSAIEHTGGAVVLCSWTTIIGYGTMMWTHNQAMASFGLMAVIGEVCCIVFALIFMTAWLSRREKKRHSALSAKSRMNVSA